MLPDTLEKINKILQIQINEFEGNVDVDTLLTFFKNYKKGYWVYPGVLKRKFGLPIKRIYTILDELEKAGILDSYYELYCGNCQKTAGVTIKTFNELPETFYCELCEEELSTLENSILIYKVVNE